MPRRDLNDAPLLPNAKVKLPVVNSTPKRNHNDEADNYLEKMYAPNDDVTALRHGVVLDTTQYNLENKK